MVRLDLLNSKVREVRVTVRFRSSVVKDSAGAIELPFRRNDGPVTR